MSGLQHYDAEGDIFLTNLNDLEILATWINDHEDGTYYINIDKRHIEFSYKDYLEDETDYVNQVTLDLPDFQSLSLSLACLDDLPHTTYAFANSSQQTTTLYWDCECERGHNYDYIRTKAMDRCQK